MRHLFVSLLILAATFTGRVSAFAGSNGGELDNEKSVTNEQVQLAKQLPATLVVRVNEATKEVAIMHSGEKLAADDSAKASLLAANFQVVDAKVGQRGELDRDSSTSSWYFCFNHYNWYYPTYYYYGYTYAYTAYYSYYYAGYSWRYYGWGYRW